VASVSSLVDRVRFELGDGGKSFVVQFVADGTTNRFNINYSPLDASQIFVKLNGSDVTESTSVEESTGVLVFDTVPDDGDEIQVSGIFYRYFTYSELVGLVESAVAQHTARNTDSLGRKILAENLPTIDEYPVAVYATTLALYTLATDASFDIDISAPDGVSIPRSERYRQLMDMVTTRQNQYRELCVYLGLGMYTIDVFTLRRVSKMTNRYVPVYKPQEVDDRSYPQRVDDVTPTYGDKPAPWPTEDGELTAYQGRAFSTTITLEGDYVDQDLVVRILHQRGGTNVAMEFDVVRTDNEDPAETELVVSLTKDQTLRLANRTYWSVAIQNEENDFDEVKGGNFFTQRARTVLI
jgi:hypothetical protein